MFNSKIGVGDSTSVKIAFIPDDHKSFFDFLVIESELDDIYLQLKGVGQRPFMEVRTNTVNYGNTLITGSGSTKSFYVVNSGNKDLSINSSSFDNGTNYSLLTSLPLTVAQNDSVLFDIKFSPEQTVLYNDSLAINNSSVNQPKIFLTGTGTGSNLNLNKNNLNFEDVVVSTAKKDTVKLTNTGNYKLTIDSLEFVYNNNFAIENPPALPLELNPGSNYELIITFNPGSVTGFTDQLFIFSDSYDNNKDLINLLGYGVSPNISLVPGNINFGIVKQKTEHLRYLNINNIGNSDLVINNLNFKYNNAFTIQDAPSLPYTISEGQSLALTIKFNPVEVKDYLDSLEIVNNADPGIFAVFSGTGGVADLEVSNANINFGNVLVNNLKSQNFIIRNAGNYIAEGVNITNQNSSFKVNLLRTSGVPSNKGIRGQTRSFITNIPANDSVVVKVDFTPAVMQDYADIIKLSSETDSISINLNGKRY